MTCHVSHNDDYTYNSYFVNQMTIAYIKVYLVNQMTITKCNYITSLTMTIYFIFIFITMFLGFYTQESTVTAPNYVANIDWKIMHYIRVYLSHAHSEWCEDEGPSHSWNVMTNCIIMMKMTNIIITSIYIMKMLELILPVSLITFNYGRSKN